MIAGTVPKQRFCSTCGQAVVPGKRAHAVYCSAACRSQHWPVAARRGHPGVGFRDRVSRLEEVTPPAVLQDPEAVRALAAMRSVTTQDDGEDVHAVLPPVLEEALAATSAQGRLGELAAAAGMIVGSALAAGALYPAPRAIRCGPEQPVLGWLAGSGWPDRPRPRVRKCWIQDPDSSPLPD